MSDPKAEGSADGSVPPRDERPEDLCNHASDANSLGVDRVAARFLRVA
jgi:hypothetical protein